MSTLFSLRKGNRPIKHVSGTAHAIWSASSGSSDLQRSLSVRWQDDRRLDHVCLEDCEMLILAEKTPERIRRSVFEPPEVFGGLALCDGETLDWVVAQIVQK